MAYSKAPMVSTYQTKQINLMEAWETRDSSNFYDVDNINVVWDVIQNQTTGESYFEAIKRDGTVNFRSGADPGFNVYGIYFWEFYQRIVVVAQGGIYMYDVTGAQTNFTAHAIDDAHIGFTPFLFDNGTVNLIITDGNHLIKLDFAGVIVDIVDPDRPILHRPYPVFLDGYLFLADLKGNIQNSVLNDPTNWNAADFISVESYSDTISAIARHGQYIVAFGTASIQFFYDAANPTGTPLAPQTTVLRVGFMGGLTDYRDSLVFIGAGANGKASIYQLEGLKATPLASPPLIRRLETFSGYYILSNFREGNIININGHAMYTWTDNPYASQPVQKTYALDLDTGIITAINISTGLVPFDLFPIRSAITITSGDAMSTVFALFNGAGTSGTKLYRFSATAYDDVGFATEVRFRTKTENFGTKRDKFGSRILFDCDYAGTPKGSMTVSALYNDSAATSTQKSISLNNTYPVLYGIGRFRTIQFLIRYVDPHPMRWRSIEIDYNQGDA